MENFRNHRAAWLAGLAALVVLALVVVFMLGRASSSKDAASEQTTSAASENNAGDDLQVIAGMGGTKVAPDGKTGLGYKDTCKGAVEAATNYAAVLSSRDLHADDKDAKTVEAITANASFAKDRKEYTSLAVLRQGASKEELAAVKESRDTFHPEWSGKYYVRSCEPGKSATVSVAGVMESINNIGNDKQSAYEYSTATYELVWQNGDWKAQRYAETPKDVRDPLLMENVPAPKKAETTVAQWDGKKFVTKTKNEQRVVMDSQAYSQAFEGVTPDASHWYKYVEGK